MKATYKIQIRIKNCSRTFTDKHTGKEMMPGVIGGQMYDYIVRDETELKSGMFIMALMRDEHELRESIIEIVTERVDDGA